MARCPLPGLFIRGYGKARLSSPQFSSKLQYPWANTLDRKVSGKVARQPEGASARLAMRSFSAVDKGGAGCAGEGA